MTKANVTPNANVTPTKEAAQTSPPRPDTTKMTDRQLAQAVMARTVKPRVGEVRRLAEAVLAKNKNKGGKKAKDGARKLAKIPGQSKKKKKK